MFGNRPELSFHCGLSDQSLPARAAHCRFMSEFCCSAISILLLGQCLRWGTDSPTQSLSSSRFWRKNICKTPRGMQIELGRFQDLEKPVSSKRNRRGTEHKGMSWRSSKRNCSHTKYTLSTLCLHSGSVAPCVGQQCWAGTEQGSDRGQEAAARGRPPEVGDCKTREREELQLLC